MLSDIHLAPRSSVSSCKVAKFWSGPFQGKTHNSFRVCQLSLEYFKSHATNFHHMNWAHFTLWIFFHRLSIHRGRWWWTVKDWLVIDWALSSHDCSTVFNRFSKLDDRGIAWDLPAGILPLGELLLNVGSSSTEQLFVGLFWESPWLAFHGSPAGSCEIWVL